MVSDAISGSGNVIQAGSSTLTLSGGNSYTGGTTISTGTLQVGSATALGTGAVSVIIGCRPRSERDDDDQYQRPDVERHRHQQRRRLDQQQYNCGHLRRFDHPRKSPAASWPPAATSPINNVGTIGGGFALTLGGAATGSISSIIGTGADTLTENGTGGPGSSPAPTLTPASRQFPPGH